MIAFLRKTRRSLIASGQFRKYLSYAIGEIVLIVIGILIALQINNWNENRKTRVAEIGTLLEIKNALKTDLRTFDEMAKFYKYELQTNEAIIHFIETSPVWQDSMYKHFAALGHGYPFILNTTAYEFLKSKGFNSLKNDSIRLSLEQLYVTEYKWIEEFNAFLFESFRQDFLPIMKVQYENFEMGKGAKLINYPLLKDDKGFKVSVAYYSYAASQIIERCKVIDKQIKMTIKLIDEEVQ